MKDQLKDKLMKLYALSKQGIGGEKVNAEMFLHKLLDKHGLTIKDIDSEIPKKRYFEYKTKAKEKLIVQILVKVLNKGEVYSIEGFKEVMAKLTDYQYVFHLDKFEKEKKEFLSDFTRAYIQKHRLFKEDSGMDQEKLTDEEILEIMRIASIQNLMNSETYTKKIEQSN